jgi:RHS repeat-associated protein
MPGRVYVSSAGKTKEGYTGHELDDETGLLYMGARYQDPAIGRFLSVDPLADHPAQIDKSPYAYAWNNPVNLTDPDGRCPMCIIPIVWAVVEVGLSAYDAYDVYTTVTDPNASNLQKGASVGGALAGLFLPGGGYSVADDVAQGATRAWRH